MKNNVVMRCSSALHYARLDAGFSLLSSIPRPRYKTCFFERRSPSYSDDRKQDHYYLPFAYDRKEEEERKVSEKEAYSYSKYKRAWIGDLGRSVWNSRTFRSDVYRYAAHQEPAPRSYRTARSPPDKQRENDVDEGGTCREVAKSVYDECESVL